MLKIELDANKWKSIDHFYDDILAALRAPAFHSRGINALVDSMIGGNMNGLEPPYTILIKSTRSISPDILDHVEQASHYVAKARAETKAEWGRDMDVAIEIRDDR